MPQLQPYRIPTLCALAAVLLWAVPARAALKLPWATAFANMTRDLELSLTAHNLLGASHAKWDVAPGRGVFGRDLFVNLVWRP